MRHAGSLRGFLSALLMVLAAPSVAQNAPGFLTAREPSPGTAARPPARWSADENVAWKTDIPGLAWSSPVVWGPRVYLTTCVNTGHAPEPRKGLYIEDLDANKYPKITDPHQWKVYCLDLDTGSVLWERTCHEGVPPKPHHIKNTLASETPATDGERLYAYFGNLGLYCYDLEGELLWTRPFEAKETQLGWGTSMSPVVHEGRVYLCNDNEEESTLIALDAKTGEELWRVAREEKTNYSTPYVWRTDDRTELVVSGIKAARAYDLEGRPLWQIEGRSILAIPTPFERFGNLYLTSGHVMWGKNPFYVIKPGAKGDITPSEDDKAPLPPHLAWHLPKAGPYHPTPLVIGDELYILYDRGLLAAHDAHTGAEIYPRTRIPNGRAFTSSPWTDGQRLFAVNEDGVTFVLAAGPKFEILATNELAEDDMCMATPVVIGDRLLIRTAPRIYCLREQATASAGTASGAVAK